MFPIRVSRVGVSVIMFHYILQTFFGTDLFHAPWLELPRIPAHKTQQSAKLTLGTRILCQNPPYLLAPQPRANAPPSHECVPPSAVSLSLSLSFSNRSATRKKVSCVCIVTMPIAHVRFEKNTDFINFFIVRDWVLGQ